MKDTPEGRAALAKLLNDYSAEVTTPDRKSLDVAANMMPPGSRVYIAAIPKDPPDKQIEVAGLVRDLGLEPVPHLVARNDGPTPQIIAYLIRVAGLAGPATPTRKRAFTPASRSPRT